jgi:uncharacterized protein involved in cysteine biosynthesis
MLTPVLRAIGQLGDPALLSVLLQSIALSALCFAAVAIGCDWLLHHYLLHSTNWLAEAIATLLTILAAVWLFVPLALVIAGLYLEPVCRAVERRWYPGLPPAKGAGFLASLIDGFALGLRVAVLSVLSVICAWILPGIGAILGLAVTAWALGRGLFATVALRRMPRHEANALYHQQRLGVFTQGAALALAGSVPLLNLLLPVLGPAAMVHVVMQGLRSPRLS